MCGCEHACVHACVCIKHLYAYKFMCVYIIYKYVTFIYVNFCIYVFVCVKQWIQVQSLQHTTLTISLAHWVIGNSLQFILW